MLVINHKLILLAFLVLALFLTASESVDAKKCSAKHHKHHHKHHNKQQHKAGAAQDSTQPASSGSSSSSSSNASSSSNSGSGSSSSSSSGSSSSSSSGSGSSSSSSSSSASSSAGSSISISGFTPPKGKAGVAGGNSLKWIANSLGWYYDWTPNPDNPNADGIVRVPMLWGLGRVNHDDDWSRFQAFKKLQPDGSKYPYVMGFNEPDFQGSGSSGKISPTDAAAAWDQYLGPHKQAGSKLVSPSMAMQKDETFMAPFLKAVKNQPDIIAVHIFQDNMDGVKGVLDHYAQYGKPMWITEFACINYQGPSPVYCDQSKVDSMLWQMVQLFESDSRVAAYSVSDANNGPYGDLTPNQAGQSLSNTGKTYLASVEKAIGKRDGFIPVRR